VCWPRRWSRTCTPQGPDSGSGPILLRYDADAGHGLGKPAARLIDEWSDIYAFLFEAIGMA